MTRLITETSNDISRSIIGVWDVRSLKRQASIFGKRLTYTALTGKELPQT